MTRNEPWYEVVAPDARLTQGDLLFDCPLVAWSPTPALHLAGRGEMETLKQAATAFRADVVVVTQACDLEHDKVRNAVLCPHVALSDFRASWEEALRQLGQNPTARAWRNTCDDIANGYVWNHALLNGFTGQPSLELRVVDFHDVFTVPRVFLEGLLKQRANPRLRLLPPYREHLSQAFARFFMRVGLPQPVDKTW
jgi:hypothetical protein